MNQCMLRHKSALSNTELAHLWRELRSSGTASAVFYGGQVHDEYEFVNLVRLHCNHFWAVYWKGHPAGFVWLNDMREKSARVHFAFFRNAWGRGPEAPSIILARFMNAPLLRLKDANGEYMLDMLYGFTPKRNQIAIKRMQLTGVVIQGEIPHGAWFADTGKSEDAVFSTVTRESTEEAWLDA